jgi:hypothetical protein
MWCAAGRLLMPALAAVAVSAAVAACDENAGPPRAADSRPSGAATPLRAETVRSCRTAVYGELAAGVREHAATVGPLTLLAIEGGRRSAVEPSGVVKVMALVRTGETVTVVVPEGERRRLSLLYDFGRGPKRDFRLSDGTSSVRFEACTASQPYPGEHETQFNGGFFVRGPQCALLDVWVEGQTGPSRLGVEIGGRPCPAGSA